MKKRILISTGGSGGHVIPATAFYDHLKENFEVFLILDERGSKFINKKKYKFEIISIPNLTLNLIKLPLTFIKLTISIFRSIFFLKNKKINMVLGTGGYMSVAICIAAKILNIKISNDAALEIAMRSRGTPRISNRILNKDKTLFLASFFYFIYVYLN